MEKINSLKQQEQLDSRDAKTTAILIYETAAHIKFKRVGLITPGHPRIPQDTPGHPRIPQDAFHFLYNSFIYSFIYSFIRKQSKNGI